MDFFFYTLYSHSLNLLQSHKSFTIYTTCGTLMLPLLRTAVFISSYNGWAASMHIYLHIIISDIELATFYTVWKEYASAFWIDQRAVKRQSLCKIYDERLEKSRYTFLNGSNQQKQGRRNLYFSGCCCFERLSGARILSSLVTNKRFTRKLQHLCHLLTSAQFLFLS